MNQAASKKQFLIKKTAQRQKSNFLLIFSSCTIRQSFCWHCRKGKGVLSIDKFFDWEVGSLAVMKPLLRRCILCLLVWCANAILAEERASSGQPGPPGVFDAKFDALLFIKGDNNLPNSLRTVEQADRWRQTYMVTDEGPSYRPGDNLYVLRPPRSDGTVTPLTRFQGGYVGEPEISWRQLNHGPPGPDDGQEAPLTHRVLRMAQPQSMPDGRIVVSTQGGLTLVGSQRDAEELISPDYQTRAAAPLPACLTPGKTSALIPNFEDKNPDAVFHCSIAHAI